MAPNWGDLGLLLLVVVVVQQRGDQGKVEGRDEVGTRVHKKGETKTRRLYSDTELNSLRRSVFI